MSSWPRIAIRVGSWGVVDPILICSNSELISCRRGGVLTNSTYICQLPIKSARQWMKSTATCTCYNPYRDAIGEVLKIKNSQSRKGGEWVTQSSLAMYVCEYVIIWTRIRTFFGTGIYFTRSRDRYAGPIPTELVCWLGRYLFYRWCTEYIFIYHSLPKSLILMNNEWLLSYPSVSYQ